MSKSQSTAHSGTEVEVKEERGNDTMTLHRALRYMHVPITQPKCSVKIRNTLIFLFMTTDVDNAIPESVRAPPLRH
jgi:hypothetical protein